VKRVEIAETGSWSYPLTPEQGWRLAESGLVSATPSRAAGLWNLTAAGKVGVARVGDIELWITPKLPIERLLFLVGYALDPSGWRDEAVALDARRGLVPAVGQALWRQSERALQRGLLQGYRSVEESSYVLRGRLREADQLRRRYGQVIPMEIRHDDFTVDVAENQILLAATTRMLTVPRLDDESRRRLAALRPRLADVTTLVRGTTLPAWRPTRLNRRYLTALRLAEIVWRATSPEHAPGAIVANGFLFNLNKIFEDFVTVAVSESLHARFGGCAYPQYEAHLDRGELVGIKPDLVWKAGHRIAAVLDAKYKQQQPNDDYYQMLAYCTALDLPRGHLVYAKGAAQPARHVIRHSGVEIVCHALDLTREPSEVLADVARVVDDLAGSARVA